METDLLDLTGGPTDARFATPAPVATPPAPAAPVTAPAAAAATGLWVGAVYALAVWLRAVVAWSRTPVGAATVTMFHTMRNMAPAPAAAPALAPVLTLVPPPAAPVPPPAAPPATGPATAALEALVADTAESDRIGVAFYALPDGRVALVAPFIRGTIGFTARPALKVATGAAFDHNTRPSPAARDGAWVMPARGVPSAREWCRTYYGVSGGAMRGTDAALTEVERLTVGAPAVAAAPRAEPTRVVVGEITDGTAAVRQAIPTIPAPAPAPAPGITASAPVAVTGPAAPGPSPAFMARVQTARARNAARGAAAPVTSAPALAALDAAIGGGSSLTVAADDPVAVRAALTDGQLVAGARAEQQGALVGWTGRNELSRAMISAARAAAGAPAEWDPKPKSAHAHAGAAVGKLSRGGLVPRVARDVTAADKRRGVASRWIVSRPNTAGQVGDTAGRIAMTAELMQSGALVLDGDPVLCADVRGDYDRLCAGELYAAADVTAWLAGVLRNRLGAVRLAQAWYVRHGNVALAAALCEAVSEVWGTDWLLPALPVATSAQLRAGLARGLTTEARDVLDDLARQRKAATEAKRADIGPAAAATLLARLTTVAERATQYAVILGAEHLGDIRKVLRAAIDTVEPLADGTSQRGAMLELD